MVLKPSVALSYHVRVWRPLASRQLSILGLALNTGHAAIRKRSRGSELNLNMCTKCGFDSDIVVDYSLANLYGHALRNATIIY